MVLDVDGDGYLPCSVYTGTDPTILGGGDCDDADAGLFPEDADGDGSTLCDGDCDDTDPLRAPGFVDAACDGLEGTAHCRHQLGVARLPHGLLEDGRERGKRGRQIRRRLAEAWQ